VSTAELDGLDAHAGSPYASLSGNPTASFAFKDPVAQETAVVSQCCHLGCQPLRSA
jgi:Rieske Fe-S protein